MPHLFVDRPREFDIFDSEASPRDRFRWETLNTAVYLVGGMVFVVGSVLFFPRFDTTSDTGAWIFLVGSLLYLVVAGHDAAEVARHQRGRGVTPSRAERLEAWAAASYLLGSALFAVGSVCFFSGIDLVAAGAWCFITGSVLFTLGAIVNVLQIVEASDRRTLQLMNLTALSYVTGSVLFAVASVPFLFTLDPTDQRTIHRFLAGQYVAGSTLFLIGGVINYRRARIVADREIATGQQ